ncbi:hypothetical protein [Mucilaginibacter flavus]|uniref:hypothetical protein n=1 Tax=Mucilaginibacter flavus TaxID=931504 RepID=UPI0025B37FAC|nr:hypothetical protein [Mucilaginibacter flavus]MDN3580283.1 hypothetical protein [Mucilaginibacter flavus]
MKPKLLFSLFLLLNLSCYARSTTFKPDTQITAEQGKKLYAKEHILYPRSSIKGYKKKFDNCSFTNQYTLTQRLKMYPYSKAIKVMIVSYFGGGMPNQEIRLDSDTPAKKQLTYKQKQHYEGLVIKHKKLDYSTLIETKVLNRHQIDVLTNILFNYEYTGMRDYTLTGEAACFDPRNSVIFFDKNGKIFDHLDICFSCHRSDSASGKLNVGTECAQKFDMLTKFFIKAGIRYGSDKAVPLN